MRAKKHLGQNFLINPAMTAKIAEAGDLKPGETVVEIGPGTGLLTEKLLATGAKVIAIEKDEELIAGLEEKFSEAIKNGDLTTMNEDFLEFNLDSLLKAKSQKLKAVTDYKLIGNIPYYITGAIIEKALSLRPLPTKIVLLTQKEVAERVVAKNTHRQSGENKESILSISVKTYGTPKMAGTVGKGNFRPVPKVDSAILVISDLSADKMGPEPEKFIQFAKRGFAEKRKQLKNNLNLSVEALENLGINPNIRAEDVKLEEWLKIYSFLEN